MNHYPRLFEKQLSERLQEPPRLIQLVSGPRQVGKTTGVLAALEQSPLSSVYLECEEALHDSNWFHSQVQKAEEQKKEIIVFDEIQKIPQWSELVKLAWDRQKRKKERMHWILLGSSSLHLTQGSSESLAGRFERISVHHWNFSESKAAFKLSFEDYLSYGGYPAAYAFLKEPDRLRRYVLDSILEPVINRDIYRFATVKKPGLFMQTFYLACQYPAREVSYNKLLGQLHEAGNVDQIKHYLDLYSQAFLLQKVFKYAQSNSRTSSPKLVPSAPILTRLVLNRELTSEERGFVFEAVVGKRLLETFEEVFYWRKGNDEVDYVIRLEGNPIAIEVKTKKRPSNGMSLFKENFKKARGLIVDMDNYEVFEANPIAFLQKHAS